MYKTAKEARDAYISKYGGFPFELVPDASDDYIIELVEEAMKKGKEIEFDLEDGEVT